MIFGIFTFDSRWALVRGRYGYFMHRNGPDDIAMGPGPYKAPGASFTLGLRYVVEQEWHVYWVNPGDSGIEPRSG